MAVPVRTFAVDSLSVRIFLHQNDLVIAAALEAQQQLQNALATRGAAAAILATGNSQIQFLEHLIRLGGIEWSKVTLFHMDEYLGIGADHPASFIRYMRERVENRVKPGKFHFLHGDVAEPIQECDRYTALLQAQPIDLCCLGIGENGHLAFNDPPVADFNDPRTVKIVQLDETNRKQQAGYGYFKSLDEVPRYGLTLTVPALCSAGKVLLLAPEKRKAQPIKTALHGPIAPSCPASALRKYQQAQMLLDVDSASLL